MIECSNYQNHSIFISFTRDLQVPKKLVKSQDRMASGGVSGLETKKPVSNFMITVPGSSVNSVTYMELRVSSLLSLLPFLAIQTFSCQRYFYLSYPVCGPGHFPRSLDVQNNTDGSRMAPGPPTQGEAGYNCRPPETATSARPARRGPAEGCDDQNPSRFAGSCKQSPELVPPILSLIITAINSCQAGCWLLC